MLAQPDIILLVLDTLRADRLMTYGGRQPIAPHLDALAQECATFQMAISPAQWSIPAHASLFTGVYPSVHQLFQTHAVLPATLPTLAERLREAGYFTAAFCNNPLVGVINNGLRRGFDSFLNYSGLLTSRPNRADALPTSLIDRYRQWFKRQLTEFATAVQDVFGRSDFLFELSLTPLMVPLWQTALSFKGNTPRSLRDAAQVLVARRDAPKDKPIFAFINLMDNHMPFRAPRHLVERFAPQVLTDRKAQRFLRRFNADSFGWLAPLEDAFDEDDARTLAGMYDAQVAMQDEHLAEFFERLRCSGRLDDALLIILSDHGEHLGEHRLIGHTISLYNALIRVPLLVRDPSGRLRAGSRIAHPVSTRRVFHTALSAAGAATPAEAALALPDAPENDIERGVAFAEAILPDNVVRALKRRKPHLLRERRCDQRRVAVVCDGYKLIQTGNDHLELFDLAADPEEIHNLAALQPQRAQELRARVVAFLENAHLTAHVATESALDDPLLLQRLRELGYVE